jgi:type 2A phosphatase activator TIP41
MKVFKQWPSFIDSSRLYLGSLSSSNEKQWRVESTNEQLDLEKLKRQEPILFYDEFNLYEDELADNGMSTLSLKVRCMPSGFFILLRFFMRVDGVLVRCFDTRYHHEVGKSYILREYLERESPIASLKSEFQASSDTNAVIAQLKTHVHRLEKLFFL